MTKKYKYRITVEPVDDGPEEKRSETGLSFTVENHDDIPAIVERLRGRTDISKEAAAPLGVGLKLFGGVLLEHRNSPLFEPLAPHFRDFMIRLKKG